MEIRFANTRDIPRILELLQQVGEVHHRIRPDLFRCGAQKYDAGAVEKLLSDPARPIFVALLDGEVAGYAFCMLQVTENDPVLRDRRVLYLDDLCVEEGLRGRGIAGALLARVRAHAKDLHCQALTLNVWCGNDSAMKFYEKSGLRPQKIGMEALLEDEYAE